MSHNITNKRSATAKLIIKMISFDIESKPFLPSTTKALPTRPAIPINENSTKTVLDTLSYGLVKPFISIGFNFTRSFCKTKIFQYIKDTPHTQRHFKSFLGATGIFNGPHSKQFLTRRGSHENFIAILGMKKIVDVVFEARNVLSLTKLKGSVLRDGTQFVQLLRRKKSTKIVMVAIRKRVIAKAVEGII
ncbi:CLUMA_CG011044, isoform A [Clunio marinus]|uniref:CLUMA_CG011044, isoform A n=1 Tax=Clunio marinus TaxID=568069 RepID=A0A1J1IBT1_9DIPT|nr:CLUMA_CG011044, isoform A [Clunio marinus]